MDICKVFTEYIKNIQHQKSHRANSIFTNDVYSKIFSYLSILELKKPQGNSPIQTSRHTTARQEINMFLKFLNTISEFFTYNEVSQNVIQNLGKIVV